MQALVKYAKGPGNLEIRNVPDPEPGPGQVKIQVACTGICGSDLHIQKDDIAIAVNPPVVVGHEFSGIVAGLGEGASGWNVGDRVVAEIGFDLCGACTSCLTGSPNLCDHRRSGGYWYDGAFTDSIVVPSAGIHRLPDSVSFQEGALIEPLACVVHGVLELTRIIAGDTVLITGPGPIGLAALQVAKAQGARIVMAGLAGDRERLGLAAELGADFTVSGDSEELLKGVGEITEGRGVDAVLECSGSEGAVNAGLAAVRKRGRFTQVGLFGKRVHVDFETISMKELKVTGALGQRRVSWQRAIRLIVEEKLGLAPLISHVMPLRQWQEAFDMCRRREGLKILLVPESSPVIPEIDHGDGG